MVVALHCVTLMTNPTVVIFGNDLYEKGLGRKKRDSIGQQLKTKRDFAVPPISPALPVSIAVHRRASPSIAVPLLFVECSKGKFERYLSLILFYLIDVSGDFLLSVVCSRTRRVDISSRIN